MRPTENWRLRWRDAETHHHQPPVAQTPPQTSHVEPAVVVSQAADSAGPTTIIAPLDFRQPQAEDAGRSQQAARTVQYVAQQVPADPFNDPFGDRNLPMPAERTSDEPTLPEPPLTAPPADRGDFIPPANPTDPAPVPQRPLEMDDPAPLPNDVTPYGYDPAPAPPAAADPNCDRVYNRRDCCEGGKECDEHRRRVRESPITSISLNITPQMTVTQLDRTNYDTERQNTMRRVPARQWKNDDGEVLADGRLTNYRYNHVEIETEEGLKKIPFADLSDDDMCFLAAWWSIPGECSLGNDPVIPRNWVASTLPWKASALCHKPLYFEEVNLERYGHTTGPLTQPVVSGAHFFANVVALPYKMGINPLNECRYPLGYYRPGDCAPWLLRPVPLSIRGGLTAAAAYVGGNAILTY